MGKLSWSMGMLIPTVVSFGKYNLPHIFQVISTNFPSLVNVDGYTTKNLYNVYVTYMLYIDICRYIYSYTYSYIYSYTHTQFGLEKNSL